MKRFASFWIVLLVFALAGSVYLGCRDDILVDEPRSLVGQYEGTYHYYEQDPLTPEDTTDVEQPITFRFTQNTYQLRVDTTQVSSEERIFCDVDGDYELTTGVELEITNPLVTPAICFQSYGPEGYFTLDLTTDTVKLSQSLTTEGVKTTRHIKLLMVH